MPNTIEVLDKKGRCKRVIHSFADVVLDPHLEMLGEFFTKRMADQGCTFEAFANRPEWSWSIYGRSGKAFDKALIAG